MHSQFHGFSDPLCGTTNSVPYVGATYVYERGKYVHLHKFLSTQSCCCCGSCIENNLFPCLAFMAIYFVPSSEGPVYSAPSTPSLPCPAHRPSDASNLFGFRSLVLLVVFFSGLLNANVATILIDTEIRIRGRFSRCAKQVDSCAIVCVHVCVCMCVGSCHAPGSGLLNMPARLQHFLWTSDKGRRATKLK